MRARGAPDASARGGAAGLRYGLLGLPLAFVSLPLYVSLPHYYADRWGLPLAVLGAILLATRALDALLDPLIGRLADRLFARSARRAWALAAVGATGTAVGFWALFHPQVFHPQAVWPGETGPSAPWLYGGLAAGLVLTHLGYSLAGIVHQAWGARLGGDPGERAAVVAWREGAALVGVLLASVLPVLAGFGVAAAVLAGTLALGMAALARAPRPTAVEAGTGAAVRPARPGRSDAPTPSPWRTPAFRRLLAVFIINGTASAIPATLVLFFVRDRLQAPAWEPIFLLAYFAAGALSVPAWVALVRRAGLVRAWGMGMLLAIVSFAWVPGLEAGDTGAFLAICLASGAALGADLTMPAALLAGVVRDSGHGGQAEGAYFGWWNCASKLNLALAAGSALPLLALAGYAPGVHDPAALDALAAAYGVLPCLLKVLAAGLLWRLVARRAAPPLPEPFQTATRPDPARPAS